MGALTTNHKADPKARKLKISFKPKSQFYFTIIAVNIGRKINFHGIQIVVYLNVDVIVGI